jgi:2-polyprenyl-6-methoxyphenol hydroxylase-like FAD-dependent oxidoreductase
MTPHRPHHEVDVLVVGAGPTGLALALHLAAHGVRPRVVDKAADRVHESRALALQPRTLEVLAGLGITDQLVKMGHQAVQLRIHAGARARSAPLFDLGLADTAYPYLLFLSQAETERILAEHLHTVGVTIERRVELVELAPGPDGAACRLRHHGTGHEEDIQARYVVGCDGAHSAVRRLAGIAFEGSAYPQTFVLADIEADGIEPGAAHAFLAPDGMLFCFPLGQPASWRLLAMRPPTDSTPPDAPVSLPDVQALTDAYTAGAVRLHDPVWLTNFRLHQRAAAQYRAGPVFLAGDAAHIHSPAGAQGMNTGIQDAVNLAWKLAHTLHGATPSLLDTYEPERAPIGRRVLRMSDRAFTVATSTNALVRLARTRIAPALIPAVLASRTVRRYAFRTVAQLNIRYRHSALSVDGPNPPRGPDAGDRLPDAPIVYNGHQTTLHAALGVPGWHLLACGTRDPGPDLQRLVERYRAHLHLHRLSTAQRPDTLHDAQRLASRRLGLKSDDATLLLIRPDGHLGYRAGGAAVTGLQNYLERWLPGGPAHRPPRTALE